MPGSNDVERVTLQPWESPFPAGTSRSPGVLLRDLELNSSIARCWLPIGF